jgi:hypothetical protein
VIGQAALASSLARHASRMAIKAAAGGINLDVGAEDQTRRFAE